MAAQIVPLHTSDETAAPAVIAVPAGVQPAERLQVYVGGYPARIEEALADAFPAVAQVVGPGPFRQLTFRYAAATPLRSYNLNDAGADLPAFLSADELAADLPFLPDLAALEWRVARAFHAREEARLDPAPLAAWGLDEWERAGLRFQPAVSLVRSAWPVRDIWTCRQTPVAEIDLDVDDRPQNVLVRRAGREVRCDLADDAEADALAALLCGATLGATTQALATAGGDPAEVSTWFARWMREGLITACDAGVPRG